MAIAFPRGLMSRRRWSQIVAFLWVSLLLVAATGCTMIRTPTSQATPSQSQTQPTPSPTPGCASPAG
jgi:hypothetical protein